MGDLHRMTSKRERLERELQERRARRFQSTNPPVPHVRDTVTTTRGVALELVCGTCEGLNESDAMFCKHCGTKFNVRVRLAGSPEGVANRLAPVARERV